MSLRSLIFLTVSAMGFSSAFAFSHIAVQDFSSLQVAVLRSIVASAGTAVLLLVMRVRVPLSLRNVAIYLLLGTLTVAFPFFLIAWSQTFIDSSLGGVIFASMPLVTLVLAPMFLGGGAGHIKQYIGAFVGMMGVFIAATGGSLSPEKTLLIGAGITFLAVISYGTGGILVKRFHDIDPRAMSFGQLVSAMFALIIIAFFRGETLPPASMTDAYTAVILLGIFSTAIPMMTLFLLIADEGPVASSTITFFVPFLAIGIGAVFMGEAISPVLIVGCIMVVGGAWMVIAEPGVEAEQKG